MQETLCEDALRIKTIEKYSALVYRLAFSLMKSRSDADDIHQEVFVRYLTGKPEFENGEHEKAWFIRVTTNLCRNWWKTAWRRRVTVFSEYEGKYGQKPEERITEEGDLSASADVLDTVKILPRKYRLVIHLFYYEEMSVAEIGRALGVKSSTVRTQLTRARKKLGELLKEDI